MESDNKERKYELYEIMEGDLSLLPLSSGVDKNNIDKNNIDNIDKNESWNYRVMIAYYLYTSHKVNSILINRSKFSYKISSDNKSSIPKLLHIYLREVTSNNTDEDLKVEMYKYLSVMHKLLPFYLRIGELQTSTIHIGYFYYLQKNNIITTEDINTIFKTDTVLDIKSIIINQEISKGNTDRVYELLSFINSYHHKYLCRLAFPNGDIAMIKWVIDKMFKHCMCQFKSKEEVIQYLLVSGYKYNRTEDIIGVLVNTGYETIDLIGCLFMNIRMGSPASDMILSTDEPFCCIISEFVKYCDMRCVENRYRNDPNFQGWYRDMIGFK